MLTLRPAHTRGHADHGWLDTWHTFSFADYHDPRHMGLSVLRVINEDRVAPGQGFGMHPHQDMEIISIVLDGELEHRDSMGNTARIRPGEVQRMSAGTGVVHSEYNPQPTKPVHFLQIWILPARQGVAPSYAQQAFPEHERRGVLRCVVSPDGRDGSLTIHQDAALFLTTLAEGEGVTHALAPGRRAYVQVLRGQARVDGEPLAAGDGARLEDQAQLRLEGVGEAEVLLFDLP
ncbi:MAG: pirin family protein [Candidatus Sericytochromatia bacterium]|nr:pirin family protein [Candidatus Sericytochromatia bacterium]